MAKFIISGGIPLRGKITPMGSKNAALPIIAATLLTSETCVIENVPDILDVKVMLEILEDLGAEVKKLEEHKYQIQAKNIRKTDLKPELVQKLRASILLMGSLLAREGKMSMPHPGGCIIGKRPVGTHFQALENLGAEIIQDQTNYTARLTRKPKVEMYLDEPSVTATENAILLAAGLEQETIIKDAAAELHIQDLCHFLQKMGVQIEGIGEMTLKIQGRKDLRGTSHKLAQDEIEIGTFAVAAAATRGNLRIENIETKDIDPIIHQLKEMNINLEVGDDFIQIRPSKIIKPARIQPRPWPGLPTDLGAPFGVLATQAQGQSLIHEWMYERRLFYIDELIKMGAEITLCDPHRALVFGPKKLNGAIIDSPDIRAGIALIIAALTAKGETVINNIELVDRGYEKIEERLKSLGAKIRREA